MAMQGSVDGVVRKSGEWVTELTRNKGEGEGIWSDLVAYGRKLEKDEYLMEGTVDEIIDSKNKLKCGALYRAIYKAMDDIEARPNHPVYTKMGEFTKRYVGRRSPLGQFIRMRALFGKKTTIVATPEVIRGTQYEDLAA